MANNLVIGATSQLAHYFPDDYVKVSSRNIDLQKIAGPWDSVYITFAEQRIYHPSIDYVTPNYTLTFNLIKYLLPLANRIVIYSSCELWSKLSGPISTNTPAKFFPLTKEYTLSKLLLWNKIEEKRKIHPDYHKVVIIHPFYFNSVHRSSYFLFGKIFQNIKDNLKTFTPLEVGSLDFERDMVHAKYVVEKSIQATKDEVVGCGYLVHARKFIQDLYEQNGLDFTKIVTETGTTPPSSKKQIWADVNPSEYPYERLLEDMQLDIENQLLKE